MKCVHEVHLVLIPYPSHTAGQVGPPACFESGVGVGVEKKNYCDCLKK